MIVAVLFGVGVLGAIWPNSSNSSSAPATNGNASADAAAKKQRFNSAKAGFEANIETKYSELTRGVAGGDEEIVARVLRQFETFGRLDYKDVAAIDAKFRSESLVNRLGKMDANDIQGRATAYAELAKLHPDNQEYVTQAARLGEAWKQEQAVIAEREKKLAAERAAKAAEQARLAARQRTIEQQFSQWDGSHRGLERIIKKSMNDPDSYKHDETSYVDMGDYIVVKTSFRGKNAFGGVVRNWVRARFSLTGEFLEVIDQGP